MSTPSTSSGTVPAAATTVITARPAILFSVTLVPAAAACSVTVYDHATAASGTVVAVLSSPASGASVSWQIDDGVACNYGLTAVAAGAGATALVHYAAE